MSDPLTDQMRAFLIDQFGAEEEVIDRECAIYWYAANYHSGQRSNLYSALSMSRYRPGMIENGPEPDSMAALMYEALEGEFND